MTQVIDSKGFIRFIRFKRRKIKYKNKKLDQTQEHRYIYIYI